MKRANSSARIAGHLLVDALQAFDEAARVVGAILVLPNLVDNLRDALAVAFRRLDGHAVVWRK
jgi:hypothetical protein